MSLSGLPWPVGRDVLVRYYPWLIHWFLVNYNGERGDRFVFSLAIFFTTKHTQTHTYTGENSSGQTHTHTNTPIQRNNLWYLWFTGCHHQKCATSQHVPFLSGGPMLTSRRTYDFTVEGLPAADPVPAPDRKFFLCLEASHLYTFSFQSRLRLSLQLFRNS